MVFVTLSRGIDLDIGEMLPPTGRRSTLRLYGKGFDAGVLLMMYFVE